MLRVTAGPVGRRSKWWTIVVEAKTSPVFPQSVADRRGGRTSLSYIVVKIQPEIRNFSGWVISAISPLWQGFAMTSVKILDNGVMMWKILHLILRFLLGICAENIFTKEDKDKNLIHFNWKFPKQSAKNVQTLGLKMGLFRMICSRLGYLGWFAQDWDV